MELLRVGVKTFYAFHRQPPATLDDLIRDAGGLKRR
jgi:hypothetical protein